MATYEDPASKDLSLEEFREFRDYIHRHSGIFLEDAKLDTLRISLVTRATRLELDTLRRYFDLLSTDEDEFRELMNLITINETSFFRFPAQFDALRDHVLPEIMRNKTTGARTMRVWSAGCSTGEEPYTTAMTLFDSGIEHSGWDVSVMGTDVSTKALATAREAVYPGKSLVGLGDDVVRRHFEELDRGGYRVRGHVRRLVDFGFHNLIKEPYPLSLMGDWDVIFCRNVTIYFRAESTRRVVANFYNSLNPGGYLFVGHSETLTSISDDFECVEVGGVFLYRKPLARKARSAFPQLEYRDGSAVEKLRDREARQESTRQDRARRTERAREMREAAKAEQASEASAETEDLLAEARRVAKECGPQEVLAVVGRLLASDPNNADAHLLAAYAHADTGHYAEALAACHKALATNPLLPYARYMLGVIYQREGDLVRAVSEYKKTVYIDPDFVLAHLNLGNIHKAQGRWDAAAREYENCMRALYKNPQGAWSEFLGGFQADLLARTCERSLLECRKAMGIA